MKYWFFLSILFLLVSNTAAAESADRVRRFEPHQLGFILEQSDGTSVTCQHKILSHVPWWRVTCGKREYTVDVWTEELQSKSEGLTKITLMYHVSEGLASSGKKLVQFHSHFSSIYLKSLTYSYGLSSSIDLQNGLASLKVQVLL